MRAKSSLEIYSTLDPKGTAPQNVGKTSAKKKDLFRGLSVTDMLIRDAQTQFEGVIPRYKLPDSKAHMYKVHGQTSWNLNKRDKETYIGEIFAKSKK